MTDQAAPKAVPPVLTPRDQELMVLALRCLENGEIKIDYVKFATEGGFKDKSVASTKWSQIKRKIDSGTKPSAAATGANGAATKPPKPKTPRKPKEPKESNTPTSTTKKSAKSPPKAEEEEDDATSVAEANGSDGKMEIDSNEAIRAESSTSVKVVTNDDSTTKDADGDSAMVDNPESVHEGKGKASVADKMSAGDMSPPGTPAPNKAKKAATPKARVAPKTSKTPKTPTSETANPASGNATETPVPGSSGAKKRGRKSNAQKEAEAAVAGENGTAENGDDGESQQPAKKPRKAPVKKAKKEEVVKDGEAAGAADGEDGEETPVKKQRKKPVKKPKDNDVVENGEDIKADANDGKNGETDEIFQKPRKTLVKKKEEGAAPASEGSPAGEASKGKKKPGPKPSAAKARKDAATIESAKADATDEAEGQEKMDQEAAAARVIEAAALANAVLGGKKIDTKTVSIATVPVNPRDWGTPVNGISPSPSKGEVTAQLGKELVADASKSNDEDDDGETVFVASQIVESIAEEDDEAGDTIAVATE